MRERRVCMYTSVIYEMKNSVTLTVSSACKLVFLSPLSTMSEEEGRSSRLQTERERQMKSEIRKNLGEMSFTLKNKPFVLLKFYIIYYAL